MDSPSNPVMLKSADASKSAEQFKQNNVVAPEIQKEATATATTTREEDLKKEENNKEFDTNADVASAAIRDTIERSEKNQERLGKEVMKTMTTLGRYAGANLKLFNITSEPPEIQKAENTLENASTDTAMAMEKVSQLLNRRKGSFFCTEGQDSDFVDVKKEEVIVVSSSESDTVINVPVNKPEEVIKSRCSQRVKKMGGRYFCCGCYRTIWGQKEAFAHQKSCKVKDAKVRSSVEPHEYVTDPDAPSEHDPEEM